MYLGNKQFNYTIAHDSITIQQLVAIDLLQDKNRTTHLNICVTEAYKILTKRQSAGITVYF